MGPPKQESVSGPVCSLGDGHARGICGSAAKKARASPAAQTSRGTAEARGSSSQACGPASQANDIRASQANYSSRNADQAGHPSYTQQICPNYPK